MRGEVGMKHLERNDAIVLGILGEVYSRHPTTAELAIDEVGAGRRCAQSFKRESQLLLPDVRDWDRTEKLGTRVSQSRVARTGVHTGHCCPLCSRCSFTDVPGLTRFSTRTHRRVWISQVPSHSITFARSLMPVGRSRINTPTTRQALPTRVTGLPARELDRE